MKKTNYTVLFLATLVPNFCSQTYNVVRMRNDKYLQTTKYSLATEHDMEGPGNLLSNYGKGQRKLRVDYLREIKGNKVIKEEILFSLQLYDEDPQIDNKMILLVDEKPVQMNDIVWRTGNKTETGSSTSTQYGTHTNQYGQVQSGPHQVTSTYSHAYRTASFAFSPPDQLKILLQKAATASVRIYLGAEVATAQFDNHSIEAVHKFYTNKVDEEMTD